VVEGAETLEGPVWLSEFADVDGSLDGGAATAAASVGVVWHAASNVHDESKRR
jgi:hypothetical protein